MVECGRHREITVDFFLLFSKEEGNFRKQEHPRRFVQVVKSLFKVALLPNSFRPLNS